VDNVITLAMTKELTPIQGRLIDARSRFAERVFGEEPKLYNHAVLCSLGLPYRNPGADVRNYQRTSGKTSLILEAGMVPDAAGGWKQVGLPYGAKSRLLLLHLCSEAVKSRSPQIEVGDSFTAFARKLGLDTSGKSLKELRKQILRMSVVSMRLSKNYGDTIDVFQGHLFSKFQAQIPDHPDQLPLWTNVVEFAPEFYYSLANNAVPLSMDAIGALKHSARGLDIYMWLAHRLWRIPAGKPVHLKWTTLRYQFGRPNHDMKSFKKTFTTALLQVLQVYPRANVKKVYGGIELQHSKPPIAPKREPIWLA
jgi:hypothetical protein